MLYFKYIIFILFVSSCIYKTQKIQENDIKFVINELKQNPSNWERIANNKSISDLDEFFLKPENIKIIQDFFKHIKFSKFEPVNIKNEYIGQSNQKLTTIIMGRKDNEFKITFTFLYFDEIDKWKLINLESKSTVLEKFQKKG